jgi:hypothetical protein
VPPPPAGLSKILQFPLPATCQHLLLYKPHRVARCGSFYNINKAKSTGPEMQGSLYTGKVRVITDDAMVFSIPKPNQPMQNSCTDVEASLSFNLSRRFMIRICYKLQLQHDSAAAACCILYLTSEPRLAVDRNVVGQAVINPVSVLSITPRYTLINAYKVGWGEGGGLSTGQSRLPAANGAPQSTGPLF